MVVGRVVIGRWSLVMRSSHRPAAISVAFALALFVALQPPSAARSAPDRAPGFAVVELFTSEGCSSCPPADALLGRLVSEARDKGLPVYCLAFHVDYWDRLGWKDPFSAAAFSQRQEAYAQAAGSSRIYTPQMIVNGRDEFVGSDGPHAEHAIASALARAATANVELQASESDAATPGAAGVASPRTVKIAYSVTGATKDMVLDVAAVEAGLVSHVARGENSGRMLRHENVVRAFVMVPLKNAGAGTVVLRLPADTAPQHTSIVAYVQDRFTLAIRGAAAVACP